jgi:glycosyltransferase involved in cell wall biosynthesis
MVNVALLALFKNESHILREWINAFNAEGIDKFYLVDNGSTDSYQEQIAASDAFSRVVLMHDNRRHAQHAIYNDVFTSTIQHSGANWLIVCDLDEVIYASNNFSSIAEYLGSLPESVSSVSIPWKIFGSSGYSRINSGEYFSKLVLRDYYGADADPLQAARPGMINNRFMTVKSICRIDRVAELHNHLHVVTDGVYQDQLGNPIAGDSPYLPISEDIIEHSNLHLNHYVVQSKEYFASVKMTRGDVASAASDNIRDWNYFDKYDLNLVEDPLLASRLSKI